MPTYQYVCTECGHELEAFQSFTDDALTVCPVCEGKLRKVYGSVGVVFKGSGFYRNDSRSSSSESLNPVKKDSGKESSGDSGTSTGGSKEAAKSDKPSSTPSTTTGSGSSSSSSGSSSSSTPKAATT